MKRSFFYWGLVGLWLLGASTTEAKPKARKLEAGVQVGGNGARTSATAETPAPDDSQPSAASEPAEPAALTVTPAAATPEAATPAADSSGDDAELAGLQTELTALMDELVQARTRAALIGKTLWKTQVRVHVQNLADDAILAKIVLKLDGAPIFRGDSAAIRGDESRQVFEGFLAPGPHVLTAEVEQTSRDDSAYGYSLRETYKFQAIRDKRNELSLVLKDDSDVASEFPDEQDGEYDIRTQLRVRTKELGDE